MRESEQTSEDDPGEGVPFGRLDDGGCQAAERQEAHSAKGSRMEVGGVPFADVRRRCDRRAGLHRKERLLEARGDQPGDLAVATHCSPCWPTTREATATVPATARMPVAAPPAKAIRSYSTASSACLRPTGGIRLYNDPTEDCSDAVQASSRPRNVSIRKSTIVCRELPRVVASLPS